MNASMVIADARAAAIAADGLMGRSAAVRRFVDTGAIEVGLYSDARAVLDTVDRPYQPRSRWQLLHYLAFHGARGPVEGWMRCESCDGPGARDHGHGLICDPCVRLHERVDADARQKKGTADAS